MRLNAYKIYSADSSQDDYGQEKIVHTFLCTENLSIFLKEQKIDESDPRYIKATHVGLIKASSNVDIKENYKIEAINEDATYIVKLILEPGSIYKQFLLEKVK